MHEYKGIRYLADTYFDTDADTDVDIDIAAVTAQQQQLLHIRLLPLLFMQIAYELLLFYAFIQRPRPCLC